MQKGRSAFSHCWLMLHEDWRWQRGQNYGWIGLKISPILSGRIQRASCFSMLPEVPNLWNVHFVILKHKMKGGGQLSTTYGRCKLCEIITQAEHLTERNCWRKQKKKTVLFCLVTWGTHRSWGQSGLPGLDPQRTSLQFHRWRTSRQKIGRGETFDLGMGCEWMIGTDFGLTSSERHWK